MLKSRKIRSVIVVSGDGGGGGDGDGDGGGGVVRGRVVERRRTERRDGVREVIERRWMRWWWIRP